MTGRDVVLTVMISLFVTMLITALLPGARRRHSARWIRDLRAPITAELTMEVQVGRWRCHLGGLLGALLGTLLLVPLTASVEPWDDDRFPLVLAGFLIPLLMMAAGQGLCGLGSALRGFGGPTRVAHAREPRVTDAVSRTGLVVMRLWVATMMATGIALIAIPGWTNSPSDRLDLLVICGSVVMMATVWSATEWTAHRLLRRPLRSSDAVSLFWRTALRDDQVRDIYGLPASLGQMVVLVMLIALPHSVAASTSWWPTLSLTVVAALVIFTFVAQLLISNAATSRTLDDVRRAAARSYGTV